jgi:phage shock protein C
MLGGVCAGIAATYNIDVTLVRIAFILVTLLTSGLGILFYLAAWLVMPGPEQVSMAPRDIARANVDDVVATAKRRAADLRHVNADDIADTARRAADDLTRAATSVAQTAREAFTRDTSTPTTPASTTPPAPVAPLWTRPPARPRARHAGFKPRQGGLPGSRRPGRGS